jgi:3-phenylpropionate/trans-cinnamate dioxygenase ferredoxin reductase component
MARYENLIVGGGLAGGMVAQEYREAGGDGTTAIVTREAHPPYHRPPLTKEYLRGEKPAAELLMHEASWWKDHGVDLRMETEVARLDVAGRAIELDSGERIEFGRLALATGATPRSVDGAATIRSIEDSTRIARLLDRGEGRIAVLGSGFIGVEAAASARMKGFDVTLVTQNEVVWDHLFGPEVGRYFQRHLEEHGVNLMTGRSGLPEGLAGSVDLVIAGIGVTPNIELARDAGLPTGSGVLVDERLVAVDGVWAVGDIAEYQSAIHGRRLRIEHWDVALNQGGYVGRTWAGAETGVYDVVPYFFSDIGDWTWMEYVGPGTGQVDIRGSMADDDFVAYYVEDGRVTGCLGVNRSDAVEAAKELIRQGAPPPG